VGIEYRGHRKVEADAAPLNVLLLEDCPQDAELILDKLQESELPFELVREDTRASFLATLESRAFDLILADYSLPSFDGLSALQIALSHCPQTPFIFVSGAIGEEQAVETLRLGATDYVLKHHLERLVPTVQRALREAAERAERAKLAEENARLYQQARQEAQRKDEFLAMLAHELRNPLGAICTAAELMRLCGVSDPTLSHARDVIERQSRHMKRLIDDLLDISRVMRGKIELRREPLDLAALVRDAVQSMRPAVETGNHELSVCLPPEPLTVQADPTRLAQVVVNLLDNAAKYTRPGGQIWLDVCREGKEGVVRVRDNGIGIDPQMLPRVFDLFAQDDRSLARSRGGLGIGLTLVRILAEMHGGNVRAASTGLEQGSEFEVRLPLWDCAASTPVPAEKVTASPAARRILIVEDNDDTRLMLRELLERCGHAVQAVAGGEKGLDAIRRQPPDVALIDIGLPDLDGYRLAQTIRAEGQTVYMIALTGYGQPEDRRRALAAGFDAHLTKPVNLGELSQIISGQ
jgi:signal transduction histidine kinase